jgi:hypothetical protein
VGVSTCETCHAAETRRWRGSHHDLAMQKPDERTVQGDFGGRRFEHQGVVTTFSKRDGRYLSHRRADGKPAEFEVAFLFGVTPLEQYLLKLPGGRLRRSGSPGTAGRSRRAGSASSTCIRASACRTPTCCTGRSRRRTGTASAPSATRRTCAGLLARHAELRDHVFGAERVLEACHGPASRHVQWALAAKARGREPEAIPASWCGTTSGRSAAW